MEPNEDRLMLSEGHIPEFKKDPIWRKALGLASFLTHYPDGYIRMCARKALKRICPHAEIQKINGKQYIHGVDVRQGAHGDVYVPVPKLKPEMKKRLEENLGRYGL